VLAVCGNASAQTLVETDDMDLRLLLAATRHAIASSDGSEHFDLVELTNGLVQCEVVTLGNVTQL